MQQERTRVGNSVLGKCLNEGRLVAGGVDELVVQDLDVGVVAGEHDDLVGDGLGIGEGGNVLSDTREAQLEVLGVGTGQLRTALLADDDEVERRLGGVETADETAHTRVNTTAETFVGRADDDQSLGLTLGDGGLGGLEDLVGGLTVAAGVVHGLGSAVELGRGNNLHGVGDLLDVANGLETALDLTKSGISSSVGSDGSDTITRPLVSFQTTKSTTKFPSGIFKSPSQRAAVLPTAPMAPWTQFCRSSRRPQIS